MLRNKFLLEKKLKVLKERIFGKTENA